MIRFTLQWVGVVHVHSDASNGPIFIRHVAAGRGSMTIKIVPHVIQE